MKFKLNSASENKFNVCYLAAQEKTNWGDFVDQTPFDLTVTAVFLLQHRDITHQ